MKKIVGVMLILVLALTPVAFAASPWTEGTNYSERIGQKLEFGLKNVLLGWVDLFYEPNKAASEGGNAWSAIGKGVTDTVLNEVGGAFHLVTFPVAVDLPLPDNGVNF